MNCGKVKRILVDYAEGAVSARARRGVERHLSECEACRAELASIRALRERISLLASSERDERFWERFNARLSERLASEQGATAAPVWRPLLPLAAGTAVVCIGLAILVAVLHRVGAEREAEPTRIASAVRGASGGDSGDGLEQAVVELVDEEVVRMLALMPADGGEDPVSAEQLVLNQIYEPDTYDLLDEGLPEDVSPELYEGILQGLEAL
ncbi:MAG: hypothetical protein Kow0099_25260 [Candidatus Abyssubacteria bacterium]